MVRITELTDDAIAAREHKRQIDREYQANRRKNRAPGMCVTCMQPVEPGYAKCVGCNKPRVYDPVANAALKQALKDNNQCVTCGGSDKHPDAATCRKCSAANTVRSSIRYRKFLANGLCGKCGKQPREQIETRDGGTRLLACCIECEARNRARGR